MRRIELIEGTKKVLDALERSGVKKALMAVLERGPQSEGKERPSGELISALNSYAIDAARFSETERHIVSILGLAQLMEARAWIDLTARTPITHDIYMRLENASRFLPKFMELIEQDHVETMRHDPGKAPANLQGKALLSVIILEEKDNFSNPKRVIETLEAIQLLYESVAILNGQRNEQQMILLACDSGSDKSFDLLGVAKLVEAVKEIILSLWDRVVFFREQKTGVRLELIASKLPIIEKISEMEKAGHLEREQAAILRRDIGLGAEKFINAGAIIPEIESYSHFNPRQLMSPEPKLLAMPSTPAPHPNENCPSISSNKPTDGDDLSVEDRAELEKFFKQMKRKKKAKKSGDKPSGEASTS